MIYKRIIYALLYSKGFFHLSRNFKLQKVGDISWLKNNFGFGETCDFIDELIIILVTKNPDKNEVSQFFKDVNLLREKIFVPITLGGGIRGIEYAKDCFANGADKILINYLVHKDEKIVNKISQIYGNQATTLMVDYKNVDKKNYTFFDRATKKSKSLKSYFEMVEKINFGELIVNSIDMDGTAFGFDARCLDELPNNFNKPILIMGGAGKPEHFGKILEKSKVTGVVTANLFNFLGNGLKLVREYSIDNGVKLIKFNKMSHSL